ncbi:hypothetical protein PoMZ_05802, partial [Pyricularia oryzae]
GGGAGINASAASVAVQKSSKHAHVASIKAFGLPIGQALVSFPRRHLSRIYSPWPFCVLRIPDEYFMIIDKEPGDQQWSKRPWRNLTAGDVPLGSVITNPKRPEEAVAQLRLSPARDVQSVKYKQFAAAGLGTGYGDLLQEMPERRRDGFHRTTMQFVTGATTFSRLQSYSADKLMRQQAARVTMAAGVHLFLVTGTMVAEGECIFTTSLDGNDRSETHTQARVDKPGFGPRLLGLKLVEVWQKSPTSGEVCSKPYRPTSGYTYAYEEDRVEGVYTVLDG